MSAVSLSRRRKADLKGNPCVHYSLHTFPRSNNKRLSSNEIHFALSFLNGTGRTCFELGTLGRRCPRRYCRTHQVSSSFKPNRRQQDIRHRIERGSTTTALNLNSSFIFLSKIKQKRAHIATSNDPSLRALIRDDSPDTTTTTTTTTYTTKDNSGRASPRKKTTVVTKESRSSSAGARRGSHSHSHTEDEELEEREVRGFMEHMQGELHEAKDLAKQLEDTLHAKFTTGNSSHGKSTLTSSGSSGGKGNSSHNSTSLNSGGRRGSKDQSSYSRHDSGHSSSLQHQESEQSSSHLLRSRRLHHDDDEDDEEEGGRHRHSKHHHKHHHHHHHHHGPGWGTQVIRALKNHVVDNFCQYTPKPWRWLQDVSSFLFLESCRPV